jgi:hypothetical protein
MHAALPVTDTPLEDGRTTNREATPPRYRQEEAGTDGPVVGQPNTRAADTATRTTARQAHAPQLLEGTTYSTTAVAPGPATQLSARPAQRAVQPAIAALVRRTPEPQEDALSAWLDRGRRSAGARRTPASAPRSRVEEGEAKRRRRARHRER